MATFKNKRNAVVTWESCERCGKTARLESFDADQSAGLFRTEEVRVLRHCPICDAYTTLSPREWYDLRGRALGAVLPAYQQQPANRNLALEAISVCEEYQERQSFEQIAPLMQQQFPADFEVWARLGMAYARFMLPRKADECYGRSLQITDHPETRVLLTMNRLYHGWHEGVEDEALRIMRSDHPDADLIGMLLAEAHQYHGRHDDALAVLNELTRRDLALKNNAYIRQLQQASETNRYSDKPAGAWQLAVKIR